MNMSKNKLGLTLLFLGCFYQCFAKADCEKSPDLTTTSFFNFYLKSFKNNEDPLVDSIPKMSLYITRSLLTKLTNQINSPDGREYDYFTKSQDYMDEWINSYRVIETSRTEKSAKERVLLGVDSDSYSELEVTLVKNGSCWKIDKVEDLLNQSLRN